MAEWRSPLNSKNSPDSPPASARSWPNAIPWRCPAPSTRSTPTASGIDPQAEADIEALRPALHRELTRRLLVTALPEGLPETTPRNTAAVRLAHAHAELVDACDGFLRRAAIKASLTATSDRDPAGMILTRATDNRLKTFSPAATSS